MADDLYHMLGVSSDAPERAIKRAYHDLARKMHPDKAQSPEEAQALQEQFAAITRAYNILKDPQKRREYDKKRGAEPQQTAPRPAAKTAATDNPPSDRTRNADRERLIEAGRQSVAEKAYQRGVQCFNMGDYARAIEFFESAIKNNAEDARYHSRLAQSLMLARRGFTRAVEMANKACDLEPFNVEHKIILAKIYESAGSVSLAVKTYENILKWDAENREATQALSTLKPFKSQSTFLKWWDSLKSWMGSKRR